jgi:pimeloyl-ACP methyl ester carboxylesterase
MAADQRLLEAQMDAFANLRVLAWKPPHRGESLRSYAARMAKLANPGQPCIVGGVSFGGVVALEAARFLPARACVLIGSIRSQLGLPWRWRLLQPMALLGPGAIQWLAKLLAIVGRPFCSTGTMRKLRKLASPESAFIRWAICAVLRWRPSPAKPRLHVFHIHGSADKVLPARLAKPDVLVPGGHHALTLFSPQRVNGFLADVVRIVSQD